MKKTLKKGASLFKEGETGGLWRLEQGVMLLHKTTEEGVHLTQMVLPGDVIGLECLCELPYASTAVALVESRLVRQELSGEFSPFAAVREGYLQQQRRMHEMARLRSGAVADRLRYLVRLLAHGRDGTAVRLDRKDLPTLREMSRILDTAGETICRELKRLFPAARVAVGAA